MSPQQRLDETAMASGRAVGGADRGAAVRVPDWRRHPALAGGRIRTIKAGAIGHRVPVTVFPGPAFVLDKNVINLAGGYRALEARA